MINETNSRYSYNSSLNHPGYDTEAKHRNETFINSIRRTIESDPFFSNMLITGKQFLGLLQNFLDNGGNPTLVVPEIRIGTALFRNISCLECIHHLLMCDVWEVEIAERFQLAIKRCLEIIDQRIQTPDLSLEEIIALLQSIHGYDPYLFHAKETGHRILNLVTQFLDRRGNPLFPILNTKTKYQELDKLTVLELVYLLWKHPYESDLLEDWDDEDESINDRFKATIDSCMQLVNYMLANHLVGDEVFLTLIRCIIEFNGDIDLDEDLLRETGNNFLNLMNYFVVCKVNPNLSFLKIRIGDNVYRHATCLQVTYLLWKNYEKMWDDSFENSFQVIFEKLLSDPRTDLTKRFSEESLRTHHFVNKNNIEFYRRQHPIGKKAEKIFYSNGMLEPNADVIDQLEGHSIERMTLAHYAVIMNDYSVLNTLLSLEPRLLSMVCCMTKGKALLNGETDNIQLGSGMIQPISILGQDERLSGTLTVVKKKPFVNDFNHHIRIIRITGVSLLHLAARAGHEGVLACLKSKGASPAIDSHNKTPQHYLGLSIMEGSIANDGKSQKMFRELNSLIQYKNLPALPEVNKLIHHEGYDLLYDTSKKIAIFAHQRLGKDSFGEEKRTNHKWVENLAIPELNRATNEDFKYSGFDRGHLAPAKDSNDSKEKMDATFMLENAVPQNPNLNRGAWKCLESYIHNLVLQNDLVEVFTGPLFLEQSNAFMGSRRVHIPTHLFKVIFKHNRSTTMEVYILPNQTLPDGTKFFTYKYDNHAINFIQARTGILFDVWVKNRSINLL